MSLEEAIQSLESRGPAGGGDWRPWRGVRADAVKLLEEAPAQALERYLPRLREVCLKSSDTEALTVSALLIIRCCVASGDFEPVQRLAEKMSYGYDYAVFDALKRALELGVEVWPLVQTLIPKHAPRLDQVLGKLVMKQPERLAALVPDLAMKTVFQAALWQSAILAPFADMIIATYLRSKDETKEAAAGVLKMAAAQAAPLPTERLEERFAAARGEESRLLAWVLFLERSKRKQDLESLFADARPLVRLGAYEALARSGEHWAWLLEGLLDADPQVRARVLEMAHPGIEEGKPLGEDFGRRLIASGHEELHAFISFVATKYPALKEAWLRELPPGKLRRTFEAKATRACATCRSIPPVASWSHSGSELRALAKLQVVPGSSLRRCPECWAHFVMDYWEEVDVNSKREEWSLRRLKLSELKQRADFDASHPRVASWEQGLQADLHHIEPSVREAAKWELAP